MEANRAVPWNVVLHIVRQILFSLAEAHSHGIVHRDIKPAHIMSFDLPGRTQQVKVLDFGIARAFDEDSDDSVKVSVTRKGRTVGTPGYMAPEQLRGEELGPAADLYAVGIIAHELFNGEPAFKSMSEFEAAALQLTDESLSVVGDNIPEALRKIVNQMLQKRPSERPKDASTALEALSHLEIQEVRDASNKRARILWAVVGFLALLAFAAFGLFLI